MKNFKCPNIDWQQFFKTYVCHMIFKWKSIANIFFYCEMFEKEKKIFRNCQIKIKQLRDVALDSSATTSRFVFPLIFFTDFQL